MTTRATKKRLMELLVTCKKQLPLCQSYQSQVHVKGQIAYEAWIKFNFRMRGKLISESFISLNEIDKKEFEFNFLRYIPTNKTKKIKKN